jgi:hypothetical protein
VRDSHLGYFYVSPSALAVAIASVSERDPDLRLVRSRNGNNLEIVDPAIDRVVGYVQIYDAEVVWHESPRLR